MSHPARTPARTPARPLAAALIMTLVTACGGGDKVAGPNGSLKDFGTSSINSSGGVSTVVQGIAVYGPLGAPSGDPGFQLAMGSLAGDSTFDNVVVIYREKPDLPGTGTYALSDLTAEGTPPADAFTLASVLHAAGDRRMLCFATSGTVTVSSVGGGHVKGSYSAKAACFDTAIQQQTAETTFTGAFDAVDATNLVRLPAKARSADRARAAMLGRARR